MTGQDGAEEDRRTVLLVEDEEMTLDTYRLWLEDDYDVRTATDGQEALDRVDGTVEVVLLDRRMPRLSGDEALDRMRERGLDCKVAMVTAVDPDFDVAETPFDAYLVKPVDREDLVEVIDRLSRVAAQDDVVQELFAVTQKRAALESRFDKRELSGSEACRTLTERQEALSASADAAVEGMDGETFETMIRDVGGGSPPGD